MQLSQFTEKTREILKLAFDKYNISIDPNNVDITYDIKGRSALGRARYNRNTHRYQIQFNPQAIVVNHDDMLYDTMPHEIAHIVCFIRPELGKNHDAGWKRVCASLGGTPSRCAAKGLYTGMQASKVIKRYEYDVNGKIVKIGPKHHKVIQQGGDIRLKSTHERILPSMLVTTTIPVVISTAPIVNIKPVKQSTGVSKVSLAAEIIKQNPTASRSQLIQLFMTQLSMTKAGATTYYYNLNK